MGGNIVAAVGAPSSHKEQEGDEDPTAPNPRVARPPEPPRCSPPTLQGVEDGEEVELGDKEDAKAGEGQAPGGAQQTGEPQHGHPVPPGLAPLPPDAPQDRHHPRQHQHVEEQDEAGVAERGIMDRRAGEPAPGGGGSRGDKGQHP